MSKKLILIGALAWILAGCAQSNAPVTGFWYTNVKAPLATGPAAATDSLKTGQAKCKSILGLFASGDCSIEAAMKDGNITEVVSVDYETYSILGFYAGFNLVVKGR